MSIHTGLGMKSFGNRPFDPPTSSTIAQYEKTFDVKLPFEYVEFLRAFNGGKSERRAYRDPVSGGIGEVNDFYGLGRLVDDQTQQKNGKWDFGNLWGETRVFKNHYAGKAVPFARDGGNNQFFLDYQQPVPSVGRLVFATREAYELAPNFRAFLNMLVLPDIVAETTKRTRHRDVRVNVRNGRERGES